MIKPWTITLLVSLVYIGWILSLAGGDPLVFAEIGTRFAQGDPTGTEGYDGQFFYYIAADPATAPAKIDVPAYRFQRILYPFVVRVLSFGNTTLIPWLLLGLNLTALISSVWLVEYLLGRSRVSRWYALPVGLYAGQLLSIRVDLPEPLALALMMVGMTLFELHSNPPASSSPASRFFGRRAWVWSAVFLMLAVFTKETMLISGLAYVLYLLSQKEFKKSLVFAGLLLVPFGLFQLYLYSWLGSFGLGSGGAGATPFELIPLNGLFGIIRFSWSAFWLLLLILGPIVVWPTIWALYVTGRDILTRPWHPWTLALGLNALIIIFLPNSTFREPLAMLRFTVPLVALLILYSAHTRHWRALRYSYLWIFTLAFMINESLL